MELPLVAQRPWTSYQFPGPSSLTRIVIRRSLFKPGFLRGAPIP